MKLPTLRLTLSITLSLFLSAGCSKKPGSTGDSEPAKPADEGPIAAKSITLYSWGEYFDERLLAEFTKETGIDVKYETYDASDEMRERLKSSGGQYDVVIMDDLALQRMQRTRLVRKLDQELLPNLSHIDPAYLVKSKEGEVFSLPYCWGTTLVAYNKEHVTTEPDSWGIFFDPKMKDHVFLIEERMECMENMLRGAGRDPATEKAEDIQEAGNRLLELVNKQNAQFGSDADVKEGLLSGKTWVAMMYNGDLDQAVQKAGSDKIGYFYPKEGTTRWVDNFTIPRDAPNAALAHKFINYMMDPLVAAKSSLYVRFATANKSALAHIQRLDPDLLNSAVFSDGEVVGEVLSEGSPNRQRLIHESWSLVTRAIESRNGSAALSSAEDGEESMEDQ